MLASSKGRRVKVDYTALSNFGCGSAKSCVGAICSVVGWHYGGDYLPAVLTINPEVAIDSENGSGGMLFGHSHQACVRQGNRNVSKSPQKVTNSWQFIFEPKWNR